MADAERISIQVEPRQITIGVVIALCLLGGVFAGGYVMGRGASADVVPMGPELSGLAAVDAVSPTSAAPVSEPDRANGALGEVEFMFPSALGTRPGRPVRRPAPVRLQADRVGAVGVAPPKADRSKADRSKAEAKARTKKPAKLAPAKIAEARSKTARRTAERARRAKAAPRMDRLARSAPVRPAPVRPAPARPAEPVRPAMPALPVRPVPARLAMGEAAPRPAPAKPVRRSRRRYTVQLKSAHEEGQAKDFAATLRRKGYTPRVVLAQVPGRGKLYRVRVGEFGSRAEARQFQRSFRSKTGHADAGFITEL